MRHFDKSAMDIAGDLVLKLSQEIGSEYGKITKLKAVSANKAI